MPRSLDRDQRLTEVTHAAWRILARHGVSALSVRNVAAEAGLAPSSLRYVVASQAELRTLAIEASAERLEQRLAEVDRTRDEWPQALLAEFLPLDPVRRLEMEVFIALGTAALTDPDLRPAALRSEQAIRTACVQALTELGHRRGTTVPDAAAVVTHALLDGLALQITHHGNTDDGAWAVEALAFHLRQLGLVD